MKIFNVSLSVRISQVGEIRDSETESTESPKPFNDDPLDKADQMMSKWMKNLAPRIPSPQGPFYVGSYAAGEGDSQTVTENVRINAETFEELQAILAKFHAVIRALPAMPDSIVETHIG